MSSVICPSCPLDSLTPSIFGAASAGSRHDPRLKVRARPAGNVIKHHRQFDRISNRLEMLELSLLRRTVVVGVGAENSSHTSNLGCRARLGDGFTGRVVGAPRPDGNSATCCLRHNLDDAQPLLIIERRSLCCGAAGHQKVDAARNLPFDQRTQRGFVDRRLRASARRKRSHQSRAASSQFHS